MIPKKIKRQAKGGTKEKSIANLIDYIHAPSAKNLEEKLLYFGSRAFVFEGFEREKQEMLAHAHSNVLSHNPVMHYLFSWKEGEQPTREQCEEVIDIFIEETGLSNHLIMWGVHHNTKNIHMHIAANKIDLETDKITRVNNNLDIELLHKIVAKIEHRQGWESTPNARYTCDEDGNILRKNAGKEGDKITQEARIFEISYGEKSALRVIQENAVPVLEHIQSWKELHEQLDKLGMEYRKKGSGAVIKMEDKFVKASSISREFSMKKLEKRLGKFVEKTQPLFIKLMNNNFLDNLTQEEKQYGRSSIKPKFNNDKFNTKTGEYFEQPSTQHAQSLPKSRVHAMPSCFLATHGKSSVRGHDERHARGRYHRKRRRRNKGEEIATLLPAFRRISGQLSDFMRRNCARALDGVNFELWFQYQHEKYKAYQAKVVHGIQKSLGIVAETKGFIIPKYVDWLKIHAPQEAEAWRYERGEKEEGKEENTPDSAPNNTPSNAPNVIKPPNASKSLPQVFVGDKARAVLEQDTFVGYPHVLEYHSVYWKKSDEFDEYVMRNLENPSNRAYFRHLIKILKYVHKDSVLDNSRIDAMIALRMRSTGHSQEDVEQAIKDCATQWRKATERKSWDDYAKRTTEYAFSYAGSKEIIKQQEQLQAWHECEFGKRHAQNAHKRFR